MRSVPTGGPSGHCFTFVLILTKSHGWAWSHRAEWHQHSICVQSQALEGSDCHFSCGNQGVPRRATAFRCRRSLRMTATKCTGRYRMACHLPMEGCGCGGDRLKPGYGECWLAYTSKGARCFVRRFLIPEPSRTTGDWHLHGTDWGSLGSIDILCIGTAASCTPTTGDQPSGMQT